jgi:DNA repair protein RadC
VTKLRRSRYPLVALPPDLKVVRDPIATPRVGDLPRIREPADVARAHVCGAMADLPHEEMRVLCLDSQARVRHSVTVTTGLLNSSLIHVREVFAPAILARAAGIILVHNHPSGECTPSAEDKSVTRQMVEAGRLLDLPVYDHIIIGERLVADPKSGAAFFSFAHEGLI